MFFASNSRVFDVFALQNKGDLLYIFLENDLDNPTKIVNIRVKNKKNSRIWHIKL